MNDRDSNNLKYYDELEWRITHLNRLEKEGEGTALEGCLSPSFPFYPILKTIFPLAFSVSL